MNIYLNNECINIAKSVSLFDLLQLKQLDNKKGLAVAVNNSVIGKSQWESTFLGEDDNIIIISATKGG